MINLSRGKPDKLRQFFVARSRGLFARRRPAFAYTEVLVAGTVLLTTMSLVAVSSFRISRIWKDVQHERSALCELSNQLDRLTILPAEEVEDLIESLEASSECKATLNRPQLTGSMGIADDFGRRLTLSLTWQKRPDKESRPAKLTGWLPVTPDSKGGKE